jgi:predicted amidohydrolase YtcJ
MSATLYRRGHIYSPADPRATAMLVRDGRIAWLGGDDAPAADVVVDLDGALVTPAFVDAHVHSTNTGLMLGGLDLGGVRSATEVLDAVAARARSLPEGALLLGFGWDESTWTDQRLPHAAELDRASGGRKVLLSQKSMHSSLCSSAMLAAGGPAQAEPGYDPSGWLRRAAHYTTSRHRARLDQPAPASRRTDHRVALGRGPGHCRDPRMWRAGHLERGRLHRTLLGLAGATNGLAEVTATGAS